MKDILGNKLAKGSKILLAYGIGNFRPAEIMGKSSSGDPIIRLLDTEDSEMNGKWRGTSMIRVSKWPESIKDTICV